MIYSASKIFTGYEILIDQAITTNGGIITDILPVENIPLGEMVKKFGNALIAPALIDLQLYGANKRLLSVYPDKATVLAIHDYSLNGGAAYSMPTVATNTYDVIFKCIDAVKEYWALHGEGVLGLHVEGPWINPLKRGAHNLEWIFSPSVSKAKELLEYGKGVIKMITLAPECCSQKVIELIHSYGVVVAAGHSNATYNEANNAFNSGIKTATHLYNAMSPIQHREPGMVAAIFNHPGVRCSIVPDGYHVDFAAIRIAKKIMGERLFAITDAVTETSTGYYKHIADGDKYASNGILSGSGLTMHKCFLNFVRYCGISVEEALRMCSLYPAAVMGLDQQIGVLRSNAKANFIVLDNEMNLVEVIN